MSDAKQFTEIDRLVPPREAMTIVGVRSPTTFYALIKSQALPPLIKRGRSSFHLLSDLRKYVEQLAATRQAA